MKSSNFGANEENDTQHHLTDRTSLTNLSAQGPTDPNPTGSRLAFVWNEWDIFQVIIITVNNNNSNNNNLS